MKKNKHIAAGILMLSSTIANVSAQNNDIFYGGTGDGHAVGSYVQDYTDFRKGGTGDGYAVGSYAQDYTDFRKGGIGDGHALNNYEQQVIVMMFKGDSGDGHAVGSYAQSYIDFRKGGEGDGWASNILPMQPLPMTLLSFTGREAEAAHLLQWETAQQINISYFELEYTTHTFNSFQKIGTVAAKDNIPTYHFKNNEPVIGNNFYRLKMIDSEGKFTYSNIVLLRFLKNKSTISLYPNPTASALNIELGNNPDSSEVKLEIYDIVGKKMYSHSLFYSNTKISINVSHYATGNYLIRVVNNGQIDVIKFSKTD